LSGRRSFTDAKSTRAALESHSTGEDVLTAEYVYRVWLADFGRVRNLPSDQTPLALGYHGSP
jgi:hypothetical protein